jgi:hypothetical protein
MKTNSKLSSFMLLLAIAWLPTTTSTAQDSDYQLPRTVDGVPDLQGMWTNNTITPLSRPARFEDKLVLTPEEAIELEQVVADYTTERDQPSDPDRGAPVKTAIQLADSYNNFWFDGGTLVAQYNGEYRSSLIVDPTDGQIPAYTAQAEQRIDAARQQREIRGAFAGPESRPLPERCLMSFGSSSGPPMLPILYNNHYQIVQSPGYVMILVEMVHDVRIIRIDDDPLPQSMRRWMGDSVGHWEGDTLVVESSRFNSNQRFRNSSENFRVLERFTRVSEQQINYEFTVNDPDTFEQPFTAQMPMNLTDDRLYEYACHEGNYSMAGILAGWRRLEALGQSGQQ